MITIIISTHSNIDNMKNGTNTHDRPTDHAGVLNPKQTKIQDINAPLALNSAEEV